MSHNKSRAEKVPVIDADIIFHMFLYDIVVYYHCAYACLMVYQAQMLCCNAISYLNVHNLYDTVVFLAIIELVQKCYSAL